MNSVFLGSGATLNKPATATGQIRKGIVSHSQDQSGLSSHRQKQHKNQLAQQSAQQLILFPTNSANSLNRVNNNDLSITNANSTKAPLAQPKPNLGLLGRVGAQRRMQQVMTKTTTGVTSSATTTTNMDSPVVMQRREAFSGSSALQLGTTGANLGNATNGHNSTRSLPKSMKQQLHLVPPGKASESEERASSFNQRAVVTQSSMTTNIIVSSIASPREQVANLKRIEAKKR